MILKNLKKYNMQKLIPKLFAFKKFLITELFIELLTQIKKVTHN